MNKLTYFQTIKSVRDSLPPEKRESFDLHFVAKEKNPTMALLLSLFLGALGIDRFYTGNVILGFLKLFTFGGIGIWAIIDLFLIMGASRDKNVQIAQEAKMLVA